MVSSSDSIWKGRGFAFAQLGDSHFVDRYPWPHSEMTIFFTPGPVVDWDTADGCDRARFARFFQLMLDRGVLLPPSQFEAWFVSAAHTDKDVDTTLEAAEAAMLALAQEVAGR